MTTIHYRDGHNFTDTHFDVAGLVRRLVHSWHQWQTAREIESMPFDIRKDIGWPSADEADEERKVM
ncbi:hypothetical protein HGP14_16425 [Rhizobium sp. P32RR-XVIII]|uniref:hypothetical protein n=1 Tax=Rhizobium sp. P32RR-XVIII TaxID=2726738 RepID=UPI00145638EE|nr:hypothetical protein [Rhizobium sp. P32RR-XVIII]NLS04931.1 hypothetical protein [Rhizobium sp. P32RR-XVIII]